MTRTSARRAALMLLLLLTCLVTDRQVPAFARSLESAGVWPLDPRPDVLAGFSPPAVRWGAGHRGVDLAGTPGQPVLAALGGRVAFAGRIAGRGVVVVDHGATRTTYEPVAAVSAVGDVVARGQVLGHLEVAGGHCPPRVCLHWGHLRGEVYLDPLLLVGGGSVRLLPLDAAGSPAHVAARTLDDLAHAAPGTHGALVQTTAIGVAIGLVLRLGALG